MNFVKPQRSVDRVFIHCSASSSRDLVGMSLVTEIMRWHKARGFATIGYHYLIDFEGTLLEGRDLERNPAAQKGHNRNTIAICLHGGGGEPPANDFTAEQFKTLRELCSAIRDSMNVTFHGHREVAAKECPVFDYRKELKLNKNGYMIQPVKEKISCWQKAKNLMGRK